MDLKREPLGESSSVQSTDALRLRKVGVGSGGSPVTKPTIPRIPPAPTKMNHNDIYPPDQAKPISPIHAVDRELPKEDQERSITAQLWLQSRFTDSHTGSSTYTPRGEDRPVNIRNIKIAVQLVLHLWRPFLGLFWEGRRLRVIGFMIRKLIRGSIPAAK